MGDQTNDDALRRTSTARTEYLNFLDDENLQGIYVRQLKEMIFQEKSRLIVNINDLRRSNPTRAAQFVNNAFEEMIAFELALSDFVAQVNVEYKNKIHHFFIGLEGSFGRKHVTPRTLTSRFLGHVVCVEGIVTKLSLVRPKVVKSVHYCPITKKVMEKQYTDLTSYEAYPSSSSYPKKDDEGNLLETEYGLSIYKDHQTFSIQEMPEKAPPGQLPRSVDIIADNDLVDNCKPGDRVQVVGIFRCLPSKQQNFTNGTFRTILIANNIKLLSKEVSPMISTEDVRKCKKFSIQKNQDIFEVLSKSLAPSIHGHLLIKKALLCMLLGGVEKVLQNGTRLRGDINVLLIGDPSVAKSQLLRYVLHSAPRAIATTGRGSSGVGLTAAVTTDFETGERRLEAGAMVLADRGVVCIDEFDKMSDIDRTAIHEVMEQGRVTITKAGINAKLNARCSVLAAANPVYGRYEEEKSPMENIGLQDSLLSRFDLLFIMLDKSDEEADTKIANHVLRIHRYRSPNEQDGEPLPHQTNAEFLTTKDLDGGNDDESETPIYEKHNKLLHGSRSSKCDKIVSVKFMKKYIHIAKSMKPELSQEACDVISEEYAKLRSAEEQDVAKTQPVTPRTLETLIRLSTAHAKARLSRKVEADDAIAAIELINFAIFKKFVEKRNKRKDVDGHGSDGESVEEHYDEDEEEVVRQSQSSSRKKLRGDDGQPEDVYEFQEEESQRVTQRKIARPRKEKESQEMEEISDDRMKIFMSRLFIEYQKSGSIDQTLPLVHIVSALKKSEDGGEWFTEAEITWGLSKMQDLNKVMVTGDVVFLI